jgi:OmpA-OmpF porin, OOP family
VARLAGSEILRHERRIDTTSRILVRPFENPTAGAPEPHETWLTIRGDLTRITYGSATGARLKEVYRYHESALQAAGFEVLYNCAGESCSPNSAGAAFNEAVTPTDARGEMLGKAQGQRYLAAKLQRAEGHVYASIYCVRTNPQSIGNDSGRVYTTLFIVETR